MLIWVGYGKMGLIQVWCDGVVRSEENYLSMLSCCLELILGDVDRFMWIEFDIKN